MTNSFTHRYEVNNVPWHLKPFYWIYGYGIGFFLFLYGIFIHISSRIEYVGDINLLKKGPVIVAIWHRWAFTYFSVFCRHKNHVWMNSPYWYMLPIHTIMRLVGVGKIIYGATGNKGLEAANRLVDDLKKGSSTTILPDGPSGPPLKIKKGILHLSLQSQLPIVCIHFELSRFFTINSWDAKRIPLPFSRIKVIISEPFIVTEQNKDKAVEIVEAKLSGQIA